MARRGRPRKGSEITIKSRETQVFLGLLFLAAGVSLFINNSLSGALPQYVLHLFGQTTYVLGTVLSVMGLRMIGVEVFLTSRRFISGLFLLLTTILPFLSMWIPDELQTIRVTQGEGGGAVGMFLHTKLADFMGRPAEGAFIGVLFIVSVSILSGISLEQIGRIMSGVFTFFYRIVSGTATSVTQKVVGPEVISHMPMAEGTQRPGMKGMEPLIKELDIENTLNPKIKQMDVEDMDLPEIGDGRRQQGRNGSNITMSFGPDLQGNQQEGEEEGDPTLSDLENGFIARYTQRFKSWVSPAMDLLEAPTPDPFKEEDVIDKSKLIEQTLGSFKIQARVAKIFVGPSVVQYALNLAVGTKVSKVKALAKDLGLALASSSDTIRIDTIGGTSLVGIEVPRKHGHMVKIREVLESAEMSRDIRRLPLAIGKDIRGEIITEDLQQMPHLLVAGQTGTGKSVALNAILLGLLMNFSPDELRLILVDPKMVEMSLYNNLPYLLTPVITDMDKVVHALDWLLFEMQQRYKLFKEKAVRNVEEFNEASSYRLPYLILVVDEMADLILTKKGDVEQRIVRLAQLARATGIHLILATQRPSVNVITGLIKANIPARIALAVTSGIDSRVVIDQIGAESLIGKGDMLVKSPDASKIRRVQGAFVSGKEIQRVMDYIRERARTVNKEGESWYMPGFEEPQAGEAGSAQFMATGSEDPIYQEAVRLVIQHGRASSSTIQRYLKIGFNRAARLIDEMEQQGIVGPANGSKPREVLAGGVGMAEGGDESL